MQLSSESGVEALDYDNINRIAKLEWKDKNGQAFYSCDKPYLLVRDCFIRIFCKMKNIMKNRSGFKYQKCFLVYGNEGIGKTTFCCFLAYCFNKDQDFKEYNVVIFYKSESQKNVYSFREAYGVEYKASENLPNTNRKTIIISDNIPIKEDDYSTAEIVIMVSSPKTEVYKVMSNKRAPVQFYLLPLTEEEADYCENILHEIVYRIDSSSFDPDIDGLPSSYIPPEYNEKIYIYDTDRVDVVADRLKFKSEEIKRQVLITSFNSPRKYTKLYDRFMEEREGIIFERLCHIIIKDKLKYNSRSIINISGKICYHCNMKAFVDYLKSGEKYYEKETGNKTNKVATLYADFSEIHNFPAIDGCIINKFNITSVQMTMSSNHSVVNTIIVFLNMIYNRHKDVMINYILNPNHDDPYPPEFERQSSLYELGYIPSSLKTNLIFRMDQRRRILCESYFLINELKCRKDVQSDLINNYSPERQTEFLKVMDSDMNKFKKLKNELSTKKKGIVKVLENQLDTFIKQLDIFENLFSSSTPYKSKIILLISSILIDRINIIISEELLKSYEFETTVSQLNDKTKNLKIYISKRITEVDNTFKPDSNTLKELQKHSEMLLKQIQELYDRLEGLLQSSESIATYRDIINRLPTLKDFISTEITKLLNNPEEIKVLSNEIQLLKSNLYIIYKQFQSYLQFKSENDLQLLLSYLNSFICNPFQSITTTLSLPSAPTAEDSGDNEMEIDKSKEEERKLNNIHDDLLSLQYQLQLLSIYDLEEANEVVKVGLNCKMLHDLNDYLIDSIYNDFSDNDKENMMNEIVTKIKDELDEIYDDSDSVKQKDLKDALEAELKICNPIFKIMFVVHEHDNVNHPAEIGDTGFGQYGKGKFKEEMINEMEKTYDWNIEPPSDENDPRPQKRRKLNNKSRNRNRNRNRNTSDKDVKPQNIIISIKSKRIRYSHTRINSKDLLDVITFINSEDNSGNNTVQFTPREYSSLFVQKPIKSTTHEENIIFLNQKLNKIINEANTKDILKQTMENCKNFVSDLSKLELNIENKEVINSVEKVCRKIDESIVLNEADDKVKHLKDFIGLTLPTKQYMDKLLSLLPYDQIKQSINKTLAYELHYPLNKKVLLDELASANKEKYNQLNSELPYYFIKEDIEKFFLQFRDEANNDYIDELLAELPIETTEDDIKALILELSIDICEETINTELSKYAKFINKDNTNRLISELLVAQEEECIKDLILTLPYAVNKDRLYVTLVNASKDYIEKFLAELPDNATDNDATVFLDDLEFTMTGDNKDEFLSELPVPNKEDISKSLLDLPNPNETEQNFDNLLLTFPIPISDDNRIMLKELKSENTNDIESFSEKLLNDAKEEYSAKLKLAYDSINEMKGNLEKYCLTCAKTNALCRIFEKPVIINNDDNTISIGCDIYQYPEKRVYIRKVYEEIWNELRYLILFIKLRNYLSGRKIENGNKIIEILNEWIEEEGNQISKIREYDVEKDKNELLKDVKDNCLKKRIRILNDEKDFKSGEYYKILLRGNPGCGKTSFIIFLLKMITELNNTLKQKIIGLNLEDLVEASIFKSSDDNGNNKYKFKGEDVHLATPDDKKYSDIAISDSYNLNVTIAKAPIILYVTSPDDKNYKHFYDPGDDINRIYYYMDVFGNEEILEWERKSLSTKLQESIIINKCNSKYGNVPRHIYYSAIYSVCYGKDYWDELYSLGIKRIISGVGYKEFLMKYLMQPVKDTINNDNSSINTSFDSTLCHYMVKYSFIDFHEINKNHMEFISDKVFDLIYYTIKHTAEEKDLKEIQNMFTNNFNEKNKQLFQLLFEELVFYNYLYKTDTFETSSGIKLERINKDSFDKFKELFNVDIYSTKIKEVYLLHLAIVENREMIYLLNNCFIHIINDENRMMYNNIIEECILELIMKMGWSKFHYIFVSSKGKTQQYTEKKMEILHFNQTKVPFTTSKSQTITKFKVNDPEKGTVEYNAEKIFYSLQFQEIVYDAEFVVNKLNLLL